MAGYDKVSIVRDDLIENEEGYEAKSTTYEIEFSEGSVKISSQGDEQKYETCERHTMEDFIEAFKNGKSQLDREDHAEMWHVPELS